MDCLGNNVVLACTNSIVYHEINNFFLIWYYHKFNLLHFLKNIEENK